MYVSWNNVDRHDYNACQRLAVRSQFCGSNIKKNKKHGDKYDELQNQRI
jgi:LysM repeat protein